MRVLVGVLPDQVICVVGDREVAIDGSFEPHPLGERVVDQLGSALGSRHSQKVLLAQLDKVQLAQHDGCRVLTLEVNEGVYQAVYDLLPETCSHELAVRVARHMQLT